MNIEVVSLRSLQRLFSIVPAIWLLAACGIPGSPVMTPITLPETTPVTLPTAISPHEGLSGNEVKTLNSLKKVDDHPLYTMHYYGDYIAGVSDNVSNRKVPVTDQPVKEPSSSGTNWACSLFAALGNKADLFYGRNFDWDYSPALLLFTDPPGGYASVSMVDIAYLGIEGKSAKTLLNLPFEERQLLLDAPSLPFDGMNERGLVIGMAAVPAGQMLPDPARVTIGSLLVIRNILDHARDVNEAVAIIQSYNIDMEGGPPLHYLIADASGAAALVEFHLGEMVVIPNENPWLQATNFLQTASNDTGEGRCWRYDQLYHQLNQVDGKVTILEAMRLLESVSQDITQWSIVYGISNGSVNIVMGRGYDKTYTFHLDPFSR
jgi:hypothetical protein